MRKNTDTLNNANSFEINSGLYTTEFILTAALDIGENILRCGGESHRVEDTVGRICKAYGAENVDVFALPSLVIANVRMTDGTADSQVRRVYKTSNNMYKLDAFNKLSRDVCSGAVALDDVKGMVDDILKGKPFPKYLTILGGVVGAGGFAVFFGGTLLDGVAAAIAGFIVSVMNLQKVNLKNKMLYSVAESFVGAMVGLCLVHFGIGHNIDMVMIGTIMLLIPGLAFGNAVRDLLFGDTVSGIIQLVQAVLTAVTVAFGFALAIMLWGGVFN